jgi:hypothetical protein
LKGDKAGVLAIPFPFNPDYYREGMTGYNFCAVKDTMEQSLLQKLSASELRSLLILKIRNFTESLEHGFSLVSLETMREEIRAIADRLKTKELGDSQISVERTTQLKRQLASGKG